ncbi:peptidoglycan recognition family protein [Streptomyces sp. NBC_00878]|uniref:peptidoglycan recognition protein family protein n=1 Tax=Streptomyces sp. NBC_00878 TaxID=2975854 RepID=UPI00225A5A39|nr:peptidoglycan recognition family protein [Streptomyces sp. NBC_00878]MCX4909552.1 peptidoglycan recognition protein family protein [Streptomyces sp. NBC_00878]
MTVPPNPTPSSPTPHRARSRVTRRGLIGAAGAVAAGAALTPVVMANTTSDAPGSDTTDSEPGTTTETFPKTRAKQATGEAPVEAAFPIGYVGVTWAGTREVTGGGIRLTDADGGQGVWKSLSGSGCSDSNGGALLIPADQAAGYELKAPDGSTSLRSVAIDTTQGPSRKVAVPADTTRVRGVAYLPRAAWGADEKLRFKPDGTENSPTAYYPFQTLTVHHTAGVNDDPDPAATVRAIYQLHAITNDWGDIGYHFLIDEKGTIYEGRYSGDDGIPGHDPDGKVVTAFHTGGFNSGNLGIALLGNLVDRSPTDAARESLTRLVRAVTRFHGVDPEAQVTYTNPVNGTKRDVNEISGHRDWMETECPGDVMYGELATLRKAVAGSS